ncbi:DciA family protein [Streptomyces sp. NPDC054854]
MLPSRGVLDQWPDVVPGLSPKLAAHVRAVAFHAETGQLGLRPDSPAYATQLRLISSRIVVAASIEGSPYGRLICCRSPRPDPTGPVDRACSSLIQGRGSAAHRPAACR